MHSFRRSAATPPLRVLVVYGTRPEAIKMAPVIQALRRRTPDFEVVTCATAQHRDMLDQVQELFGLHPEYDLDLMAPGQRLNDLASRSLLALDRLMAGLRPDWLLVQGDTTTAATAALAAFHLRLRVGHVEAGLRTGDLRSPFPEEANRRIIDLLADALFAPTPWAARQLHDSGCDPCKVFLTGNTGVDALHWVARSLPDEPPADEVLITVHRRESFGAPLQEILAAIRRLAIRFPATRWVLPVHCNPNVSGPVAAVLCGLPNLQLCAPLAYDELVRLMRRVRLVLTDSGGIQEEAPSFGKPVLILRDTTERPEGVTAGVARLVGTTADRIVAETERLLTDPEAHRRMACAVNPYGDGDAANRIAAILAGEPFTPFAPEAS
jgi:UDP-N-acetylglucosamine 2-epimerase (non-hydrolysing)